MLFTTPPGWSVLALTAGGLLYMLYRGRQFGPRFSMLSQKRRRSKLEFVNSVAAVFESCHSCHLTLTILYRQFYEKITTRAGLQPDASAASVAAALAQITSPQKRDFYLETLSSCNSLLSKNKITRNQLEHILNRLQKMEKEIFNEHHSGK
jgi:hypothetical protein